jgi:hypothetical protein
MAITDINVTGYVFKDDGTPLAGATVELLETGTTTVEATYNSGTGTTAAGLWSFTETSLDTTYDVKITSGTSVRKRMWADEITLKTVDATQVKIRGVEGAVAPLYFFADQADDAGDAWRIQASASDTLAIGSDKASAGTIIDYITITNGANAAASTVAMGGALTAVTVDASTDFTVGSTVITDGVITDSSGLQLVANLDINGTADISGDLTLSAGADGALRFSVASSIKILDNSATALVIEEADNAYMTFVTTDSSEAITIAKATTFSAGIADSGTIAAGTWNGTAIATSYIAADAITGAKIADDAIDSEHYTDGSIDTAHLAADAITGAKIADDAIDSEHYTDGSIDNAHIADDAIDSEHYAAASIDFAHIQNVAANSILGRDANSSGVLSEVALATTQILIGDGTGFTPAALSGDATMTNGGVVSLAAAQTNVTSLLATDIKIGEDAQTLIDFETANEIHFDADNAERVKIDSTGLNIVSGSLETATIDYTDGDLAMTIADGGGVTFAQATTFSGNLDIDGTIEVGANTDGYDVKFFGNADGKYMLWDESEDDLVVIGDVGIGAGTGSGTLTVTNTGSSTPTALLLRNLTAVGSADTGVNIVWHGNTTGQSMASQAVAWEGADNDDAYMAFSTRGGDSIVERLRVKHNGFLQLNSTDAAIDHGIIFDGNAADYHIGLEDATDNLVIGIDQALGTKQVITINDDGHIGFGGPDPSQVVLFLFNADARSVPAGYGEVALMAISGSNTLTLATGATGLVSSLILYPPNIVEAGGDGVTNTATLYVGSAATEGSAGNYSFWVDAGSVRLDSSLWVEGTPTEGSAGEQLTSGGADTVMSWAAASSLGQFKDTIDVLSPEDALDKIVSWIPKSFRYKADAEMSTHDYDTTYVGVYGEDAPEVMHHEGRIFSPVSAFGYTVGAIQELHNKIQQLEAQLAAS